MQQLMKIHFAGQHLLTGLPEYRNGGLFVDMGVLTLKAEDMERGLEHYKEFCLRTGTAGIEVAPMFEPSDDVVVEWRGVTVGFLDRLCVDVNHALKNELGGNELTLPQLLEAGSWKVSIRISNDPTGYFGPVVNFLWLTWCPRVVVNLPKSTGRIQRNRRFSSTAMEQYSSGVLRSL